MASLISVGQVLDLSLEHCRKHYKSLLAITLWMVVAATPSVIGKILSPSGGDASVLNGADWVTFALSLLGTLLIAIVSVWAYAVLVLTVADQANGKRLNFRQMYKQGWQKFWPYVALTILLALIVVGIALLAAPGFILIFMSSLSDTHANLATIGVPLFFIGALAAILLLAKYAVELAFAPYILLLEKQGPIQAIKNSSQLVRGRWWATLARFAIPKLLYFLVFFVVSFVVFKAISLLLAILVTTSAAATLLVYIFSLFLSVFLSAIVTPVIIATDYYLYDSLRKTR